MRLKNFFLCPLTILFLGLFTFSIHAQTKKVIFQVDMNGVEVEDPSTIGIRGSVPPLSWDETLPMSDDDNDGIYTITLHFKDPDGGLRVLYKFVHGDIVWENDHYGRAGNRLVTLSKKKQKLPPVKWNELDEFAPESLLENSDLDRFFDWIFIVGNGKKRGLSAEEIGKEYANFWKGSWGWISSPERMMAVHQVGQASSLNGSFVLLEQSPGIIRYKIGKTWMPFFEIFQQDGKYKGVTADDLAVTFKTIAETQAKQKDWKMTWKDLGEEIVVTLQTE